ncbi:CsbD family protein [Streptomyces sp. ID05-39B]|uniref:CsbD family protein n=1 Tax=Streptomyces sp. ID05-39B TaxID=3028664 RepID=UPI0029B0C78C|nr:CsbD family protein [Streptomyces sp. ID05-39B]MDX3526884.1 CsbD family protein [Streptomyces sp. ID05-39B]
MVRSGARDQAKARFKVFVGRITGSERLEAEGRTDEVKATIRQKVTIIRHRALGMKDSLKHSFKRGRS